MKQIIINGETWYYQTILHSSEWGDSYSTRFWKETKPVSFRKYLFFGPWITKEKPVVLFTIWANSDDPMYTKDWWKKKIDHEIELLGRQAELDKGELI